LINFTNDVFLKNSKIQLALNFTNYVILKNSKIRLEKDVDREKTSGLP
jgi:hypothetical protein